MIAIIISAMGFCGLRLWLHVSAASTASAYEQLFELQPAGSH
jgi:hypothetical protein